MNSPTPSHNHTKTVALSVVALVIVSFAWYAFKRIADAPGDVAKAIPGTIEQTTKAFGNAADIAAEKFKNFVEAVHSHTIIQSVTGTGTKIAGTSRLQVATINQLELFDHTDKSTTLGIPLPDVIVSARAPVEYTYYLDLTGDWDFRLENNKHLYVVAPPLRFNKPSVDASAITYKIEKGSPIRDHGAAQEALKQTITNACNKRAQDNVPIIRELARRQTVEFVKKFIVKTYEVDEDTPISVVFADELPVKAGLESHQ